MRRPTSFITKEEEAVLTRRMVAGDQAAKDRVILAHTKMAWYMARRFRASGLTDEDMRAESMVGLTIAAGKYDPDTGVRFATYAKWWIRACLREACLKGNAHISMKHSSDTGKLFSHYGRLEHEETRKDPGASHYEIEGRIAERLGLTRKQVEKARVMLGRAYVSLNDTVGDSMTVADVIPDSAPSPEDICIAANNAETASRLISEALEKLTDRERAIIRARILCDPDDVKTFEVVGAQFGISKERVRQIQSAALMKIEREVKRRVG